MAHFISIFSAQPLPAITPFDWARPMCEPYTALLPPTYFQFSEEGAIGGNEAKHSP